MILFLSETHQEACAHKYWPCFYALLATLQVILTSYQTFIQSDRWHLWLITSLNYISSGLQGALFASLIIGVNIIRMLLLGLGVYQDEGTIKSMSRHGDRRFAEFHIISLLSISQSVSIIALSTRELLKGPLYYAIAVTLACIFYWKTSPIAIAVVCNLCAGDGTYL